MSRLLHLSRRELVALAVAFACTLPAVTPRVYASDEIQYFSYLRSLWFDRDVSFENEYRYFYERDIGRGENFHATFLELETETGRRPNFGTVGAALLWAPFYAAGDAAARALRAAGREVDVDGYSTPYVAAVAYGSAFYGFLAVVLALAAARIFRLHDAAQRPGEAGYRGGAELLAAILVWVGTPLLFYMYIAPPYAHAASAFAVALFLFVWLHVRRRWSPAGGAALGLAAALMAMVREQDVVLALGPAVDFLIAAAGRVRSGDAIARRNVLATAGAGCTAFAAALLPQLLAYHALNGYPGPSRLVARKMSWDSPHAWQVLASPEHGFLVWTPLAVLAIAGLGLLAARGGTEARRLAAIALLMIALQVYVSGSVESWTVAGAFGQRRFVAVTALLAVGLAALLHRLRPGPVRMAAGVAMALAVWWNLALTAAFGTGLMDRQRLELKQNLYDAFVTIPRMAPQLAVRYLTNRSSFYRQDRQEP